MNKFEYDICDEFDCNPIYCLRVEGFECYGEFWKRPCIFYGEHLELNGKRDINAN